MVLRCARFARENSTMNLVFQWSKKLRLNRFDTILFVSYGRLLVDPQDFREGEQAKKTREGEDENLSSPQRLKGGEIQ